ncbi:uncharacterized protein LOC135433275 [Drosophila montana]|uniref:uncharacterized protein LOC135433275 n=1 Tax=Drosophila montana TaxID=40370 RepID=UPI00313B6AEA
MKVLFKIFLLVVVINVFTAEGHRNKVKSRNSLDDHQQHHPSRHHGHNQLAQRKRLFKQHLIKRRNDPIQNNYDLQNFERGLFSWAAKAVKAVVGWFKPSPKPSPPSRPPPPKPPPPTSPPPTSPPPTSPPPTPPPPTPPPPKPKPTTMPPKPTTKPPKPTTKPPKTTKPPEFDSQRAQNYSEKS